MDEKTYKSWANIASGCMAIIRNMHADNWRPDYIVGVTRGGLIPATMLSHYLGVPMHTLSVSLRDHASQESNCWMSEDAFGYDPDIRGSNPAAKKNILIVDDINDTGATFNWIKEDWQSTCRPHDPLWKDDIWHKNVRFAALIERNSSNATTDYWSISSSCDKWYVFPWEEFWNQ